VDVDSLAAITKNFSGAEIEGLVKSATSFALNRQLDVNDLSAQIKEENIKVTMADFQAALGEVRPRSGNLHCTFSAHSVKHSVNIQCTFSEHSVNIQ
jgi:SpoVK/Ycf46/Vps4 family AAA+-type ATPase